MLRRPGATYIDFGSWIGPTVMFATPYAARVYALEPDPTAYKNVYWNVKANPHIAAKVTVKNLCISNASGSLTMSGVPGDSMSQIQLVQHNNNKNNKKDFSVWQIKCTTLDQFVKDQASPSPARRAGADGGAQQPTVPPPHASLPRVAEN